MTKIERIIDEGAESVVVLAINSMGSGTITKRRQPRGKTQYLFEAFAYKAMRRLGGNVPSVAHVSKDELVMSAFLGATLDDQTGLYGDSIIFNEVAKDLALSRKITFSGFGKPVLEGGVYRGELDTWDEFLAQTFEKLCKSDILSNEQKQALIEEWNKRLPIVKVDYGMLVHGDFALSAIFVRNGIYEGIIDYGDAFIGDPLIDLAYFRFKEITKEYGFKVYEKLSEAYAIHSGIDKNYIDTVVELYMIYWAVERAHTDNLDSSIIAKFIEKTVTLIGILA